MESNTPQNLPATTIDEVIASLDRVIEWCKQSNSRKGYFPALYRKVTVRVKEGIQQGNFQDGQRMERLDVIFANRYLEAFEQFHSAQPASKSWQIAFTSTGRWLPIVLQHLMLGMNAHIALDLGIAAAQTVAPKELPDLKKDFFKINDILFALIDDVQKELASIWPLLKLLDRLSGGLDEFFAKFGMNLARGQAWKVAEKLCGLDADAQQTTIVELDQEVCNNAGKVAKPGFIFQYVLFLIRLGEWRSIRKTIKILE